MPFLFNDLISPDITLYYHKSKTHSSIISKTLTILTLLAISAISTVILKDFFFKSRPNAFYYYNQFINDTGVYILNDSEIFHSITFMSDVKYDPKAISIIGVKSVHALTYLSQPDQTKHDHWIYESCNISTFPSDIRVLLIHSNEVYVSLSTLINQLEKSSLSMILHLNILLLNMARAILILFTMG